MGVTNTDRTIAYVTDNLVLLAQPESREMAFRRLTEARLERAYRLATIVLGDVAEAEDAVQDAAERAWQRWAQLRDAERFDAWFDRILVHACRDRMRSRRLAPVTLHTLPEAPGQDLATDFVVRDLLDRGLAELDPEHRLVVVLRFVEDLPIRAIAERTGEREGTVKSRLHYALRTLRAAVDSAERLGRGA
jgi:RNA polymerase sigma-70 factor (ECF subfamily)